MGLGKARFVPFVVTIAPVADEVDEKVAFEMVAIGHRHARHPDAGDRIVGIDMDNRNLEAFGQVAGIERAARVVGIGGKTDLIVGNNMNGAAGAVAFQAGKIERFGHNALARKGGVAMNLNGQRQELILARRPWLIDKGAGGTRHAFHHGIDMLQMAGIGGHAHSQLARLPTDHFPFGPGVIFDIACPPQLTEAGL